jgi:hypothetical protein
MVLDAFKAGDDETPVDLAIEFPESWSETTTILEAFNRKGWIADWILPAHKKDLALDMAHPKGTFESCGHAYFGTDPEAYAGREARSAARLAEIERTATDVLSIVRERYETLGVPA